MHYFNPRPPHGGRLTYGFCCAEALHFNPRPPHGGRPVWWIYGWHFIHISIHALLTEGDLNPGLLCSAILNFNPRPPHGGRLLRGYISQSVLKFQSTPSSRRATTEFIQKWAQSKFQSTPSSRRATGKALQFIRQIMISIHALLTEGDLFNFITGERGNDFNPRPPHGGRLNRRFGWLVLLHFNPRPPHGGRRLCLLYLLAGLRFQSTPSSRRATTE